MLFRSGAVHAIASAQKTASLIGDKWMYIYQEHCIYVTSTTFSSSLKSCSILPTMRLNWTAASLAIREDEKPTCHDSSSILCYLHVDINGESADSRA